MSTQLSPRAPPPPPPARPPPPPTPPKAGSGSTRGTSGQRGSRSSSSQSSAGRPWWSDISFRKPFGSRNNPSASSQVVSSVIENICGALAEIMLNLANHPDDTLAGSLLAGQINDKLNEQLKKDLSSQSTSRTMKGSCLAGGVSAGVEWAVHETIGFASLFNKTINDSTFSTYCDSETECTSKVSDALVDITFNSAGIPSNPAQQAELYRRDTSFALDTISSSASSLHASSFGNSNNHVALSMLLLVIIYTCFFNIRR